MLDTLKVFQPTDLAKIIAAITFIENPLIYVTTIFVGFLRRKVQCLLLIGQIFFIQAVIVFI